MTTYIGLNEKNLLKSPSDFGMDKDNLDTKEDIEKLKLINKQRWIY